MPGLIHKFVTGLFRPLDGWTPNPPDARDYALTLPCGDVSRNVAPVSLRPILGPAWDQGRTKSCVAQAVAAALHAARPGTPEPSRMFVYYNARRAQRASGSLFMTDAGCYIRSALSGVRKLGAPDEPWFPWEQSKINRAPSWSAYFHAGPWRGLKYAWIVEPPENRGSVVRGCLDRGVPVIFGTSVAADFLPDRGALRIDRPAADADIRGGHAMLMVGYRPGPDGWEYEIRNSWGPAWRDEGHAWMLERYLTWYRTRDLCATTTEE